MQNWETLQADVNRILSVHYTPGRSGYSINKIVVHYNAANLTIDGCYSVWQTREASAHYQVEEGGRIGQLVNDWDTAWHAGDWVANCTSIGIEHANYPNGTISDACLDNGAHLVAALCKYYGLGRPEWLVNIFPHKYFQATSCPGQIYGSQKDAYIQRAQQWYDAMNGGAQPPVEVNGGGSNVPSAPSSNGELNIIPVHYAMRVKGGNWWSEVTNFNNTSDDGYAGAPFTSHDLIYAYVDRGELRYRAHTIEDGWLDWVNQGNPNDTVNGCAGIPGHTIDGIQFYYVTPGGEEFRQAYYRTQTTSRSGWLAVCCDDGSSYAGFDGWAGMYNEPMDRLQLCIASRNPF